MKFGKLKSWLVWRVLKTAVKRMPDAERTTLMETLARIWKSRAQLAKLVTIIAAALASFGIMPEFVPLLGKVAAAITAGEPVTVIGTLMTLALAVFSLFDRDKQDRAHAEVVAALKS